MSKLESMAKEHFNQSNALGWATLRSLFPQLYEFLGPEDPMAGQMLSENQQDPNRAVKQTRGQGYIQQRGKDDRAEYVGPDSGPFTFSLDRLNSLRDEMHRVTHLMALSVDNKASSVARSGASKAQDKAATSVVLTELGNYARRHAVEICEMVGKGRKDPEVAWVAHGMENFDQTSVDDLVDEMTKLATLQDMIPSPTYWRIKTTQFTRVDLGPNIADEEFDKIESELEQNIPAEPVSPSVPSTKDAQPVELTANSNRLNPKENK
jgi:hypothetical protein